MKDNKLLVESILRRLLRESQEERETRGRRRLAAAEGLAAYIKRGYVTTVVLYEPAKLIEHLDEILDPPDRDHAKYVVIDEVIRGIIETMKPSWKCNGAWEVKASAVKNKGDGGLIYGIAFALAPGGILTPDRYTVSQKAQDGWIKQTSRDGTPFDDVDNPQTDDPSDDCRLHWDGDDCDTHKDLDSLNRSYEEEGWEQPFVTKVNAAHHKTMAAMPSEEDAKAVEDILLDCTGEFFKEYFN